MKDPDIIRSVAEFDGWNETKLAGIAHIFWERAEHGPCNCIPSLPPYLSSLDAIVPVVRKLEGRAQIDFESYLLARVEKLKSYATGFDMTVAEPRQYCEALLRTIGKWREE
jgi:hypothetical protein